MRRFFDFAAEKAASLRMTYLVVRCKLADKSEFSCRDVTEQNRMGNEYRPAGHEESGGTAAR